MSDVVSEEMPSPKVVTLQGKAVEQPELGEDDMAMITMFEGAIKEIRKGRVISACYAMVLTDYELMMSMEGGVGGGLLSAVSRLQYRVNLQLDESAIHSSHGEDPLE